MLIQVASIVFVHGQKQPQEMYISQKIKFSNLLDHESMKSEKHGQSTVVNFNHNLLRMVVSEMKTLSHTRIMYSTDNICATVIYIAPIQNSIEV